MDFHELNHYSIDDDDPNPTSPNSTSTTSTTSTSTSTTSTSTTSITDTIRTTDQASDDHLNELLLLIIIITTSVETSLESIADRLLPPSAQPDRPLDSAIEIEIDFTKAPIALTIATSLTATTGKLSQLESSTAVEEEIGHSDECHDYHPAQDDDDDRSADSSNGRQPARV